MTSDIKWSASASKEESAGEHYEALCEGQAVGELVINPKLTKSGVIVGAFSVLSSEIFEKVAVSAAIFAADDGLQNDCMPKVVPITDQTGLITQPNH